MPQMARRPFIKIPWASQPNRSRGWPAQPQKSRFGPPSHRRPMVNYLHFVTIVACGNSSSASAVQRCDPFQRFWPACPFYPGRQRGPTAGFSSSPTSRTAMGSTSALPKARSAVPMLPSPIVSRGISRRPRPIAGLIRTKSPARFRKNTKIATARAAANTSPSPASAELSAVRFRSNPRNLGMPASPGFQTGFGLADRAARLRHTAPIDRTIAAETT